MVDARPSPDPGAIRSAGERIAGRVSAFTTDAAHGYTHDLALEGVLAFARRETGAGAP